MQDAIDTYTEILWDGFHDLGDEEIDELERSFLVAVRGYEEEEMFAFDIIKIAKRIHKEKFLDEQDGVSFLKKATEHLKYRSEKGCVVLVSDGTRTIVLDGTHSLNSCVYYDMDYLFLVKIIEVDDIPQTLYDAI